MRRVFGLDWRIAAALALIFTLAFGAVLYSRTIQGSASGAGEASQAEKDCEAAKQANGGKETKECKNLTNLTFEDPIALYTFVLTAATILLFVATCGLWYMAARASEDTKEVIKIARDSANAAKTSAAAAEIGNKQARDLYSAEQRPWLYVEATHASGNTWHAEGMRLIINVKINNLGKIPATDVRLFVDGFALEITGRHPNEQFGQFVDKGFNDSASWLNDIGNVIFPTETKVVKRYPIVRLDSINVKNNVDNHISMIVGVGVTYRIPSSETTCRTIVTYSAGFRNELDPSKRHFFPPGLEFPEERIAFEVYTGSIAT